MASEVGTEQTTPLTPRITWLQRWVQSRQHLGLHGSKGGYKPDDTSYYTSPEVSTEQTTLRHSAPKEGIHTVLTTFLSTSTVPGVTAISSP